MRSLHAFRKDPGPKADHALGICAVSGNAVDQPTVFSALTIDIGPLNKSQRFGRRLQSLQSDKLSDPSTSSSMEALQQQEGPKACFIHRAQAAR
ncbi:hypothetical protein MITS9509_00436 [Synechococcus sp. MIT S9509]|nr:hypothetical protein MITS9509_00436 [Synechococcus sp. MIT S9509]